MKWMLLLAALTAEPAEVQTYPDEATAVKSLSQEVQTGTLLFSQGDCLAVKVFSKSSYTHVAVVVKEKEKILVYDSAKGSGVRKSTLKEYLSYLGRDDVHLFHPRKEFTAYRTKALQKYLDSEIGREYGVRHHVTGEESDGIHCAEYAVSALMAARLMHANNPAKVSPASLVVGIRQAELYSSPRTINWEPPAVPEAEGTCAQWWLDTKICTRNAWTKCRGWFCCN